jgi:hypothetical protein
MEWNGLSPIMNLYVEALTMAWNGLALLIDWNLLALIIKWNEVFNGDCTVMQVRL